MKNIKEIIDGLERLYHGRSARALRFRFVLLSMDLFLILFFVGLSMSGRTGTWILVLDYLIAIYLILDLLARCLLEKRRLLFFIKPYTLADLIVIFSLLSAPFVDSLIFLRALRMLRLFQSYHVARDLRGQYAFFRKNQDIIHAVLNLLVFIFIVSAFVLVVQLHVNPQINNYVDALYFTVATLTTTGFGDITLQGNTGRILAVAIMLAGFALFLRLIQSIFRPQHVKHKCPDCGLGEHDRDAVHCKHCGRVINIETDGL